MPVARAIANSAAPAIVVVARMSAITTLAARVIVPELSMSSTELLGTARDAGSSIVGLYLALLALMVLAAALSLLRERYKLGSYGLWPTNTRRHPIPWSELRWFAEVPHATVSGYKTVRIGCEGRPPLDVALPGDGRDAAIIETLASQLPRQQIDAVEAMERWLAKTDAPVTKRSVFTRNFALATYCLMWLWSVAAGCAIARSAFVLPAGAWRLVGALLPIGLLIVGPGVPLAIWVRRREDRSWNTSSALGVGIIVNMGAFGLTAVFVTLFSLRELFIRLHLR